MLVGVAVGDVAPLVQELAEPRVRGLVVEQAVLDVGPAVVPTVRPALSGSTATPITHAERLKPSAAGRATRSWGRTSRP